MFGNPISVQQWNRKYSTINGQEMAKAILPFHEKELVLRPAVPEVRQRVHAALADIRMAPTEDKYYILSLRRIGYLLTQVATEDRKGIVERVHDQLIHATSHSLGEMCKKRRVFPVSCGGEGLGQLYADLFDSLGRPLEHSVMASIERSLVGRVWDAYREEMAAMLFNCVYDALWNTLVYQVGFLAAGKSVEAGKLGRLLGLFRQGNYPCGMMDRDMFLVLVA